VGGAQPSAAHDVGDALLVRGAQDGQQVLEPGAGHGGGPALCCGALQIAASNGSCDQPLYSWYFALQEVKSIQQGGSARVQVVVSYMEIYNERMYDLLQPYKSSHSSRCVCVCVCVCALSLIE